MKLTNVKIINDNTPTAIHAAEELSAYLQKKGITVSENGFPISVAVDASMDQDGYKIEAADNGMTVTGDNTGVLYGVYGFLEKYAGVRFFTPTLELCPAGEITVPQGLIMEYSPAMKARRLTWFGVRDADWCVKNGINNCDAALTEELGGQRLNYGKLFVHTINILAETKYPYPAYGTNPCLTDPEIFANVIKNVRKVLEENPNINIVSVSCPTADIIGVFAS